MEKIQAHTFRLKPKQDLFKEIKTFVDEKGIEAGIILACVGSLTTATLRLANSTSYNTFKGPFEIVSLTGTVSTHGSHLHISISNGDGPTIGGHLVGGCLIYTTAEIVIAEFPEIVYKREYCEDSGHAELIIEEKEKSQTGS